MMAFVVASGLGMSPSGVSAPAGGSWERLGPWNIFDDVETRGEAGSLASAASPAANQGLIYAGGQNNGASSGVVKSVDGGRHWVRASRGLWDTRVLGVWTHPDDAAGARALGARRGSLLRGRG
jgi:hypothetical protein